MKSVEIRDKFLKFFEEQGHRRVKSSSLIPAADPTLLFTNAGMVQFKDCFLGLHDPGYKTAVSCQKCVRAGGKHNDLENVGFTPRHHTFFEMLGNFSFGQYFKKEAIAFAWELLTQHFNMPRDRLRITIFEKDDEAFELWKSHGIRPQWITRLGEKDNFWAMGDTGPCGPCSEIHYDWGEKYGCGKPTCDSPSCPCGTRFLEIWNLVFMQFNRDPQGKLNPLPKPSVDTGAGLERMASVLQGVYSNYDTDLFLPLIKEIAGRVGKPYQAQNGSGVSMRVIADHMRSGTFLISDGVIPSNEGRGYVLRRILRRAIRHGKKLGKDSPFLSGLVSPVCDLLGGVYPELKKTKASVAEMIHEEEVRFHETLHRGMGLLEESIQSLKERKQTVLPGDVAFKLYDTFGFPLDLIEVIAKEQNLTVDLDSFRSHMEKQKSSSGTRPGSKGDFLGKIQEKLKPFPTTVFTGYELLETEAHLLYLFSESVEPVSELKVNERGYAVFNETPFYAEGGGQVGDKGTVGHGSAKAVVSDTFKLGKTFFHQIEVTSGVLKLKENYQLHVDLEHRQLTAINHTATHILHAALRLVLGDRVKQAGSLVERERLRFDFTFPRGLTREEILKLETIVNEEIQKSAPLSATELPYDEAIRQGALAFFDEKYGDKVRVIRVGRGTTTFSSELCGGTHLKNSFEIGIFKIISESAVASGIRRMEAITSRTALQYLNERCTLLDEIENQVGVRKEAALKKIEQLTSEIKLLKKENERLHLNVAKGASQEVGGPALWEKRIFIDSIQVVREQVEGPPRILRPLVDQIRDKLKEKAVVLLSSREGEKVFLCLGLSKDLQGIWNAGQMIRELAKTVGGTGGGRADFAEAGGNKPEGIEETFQLLDQWIKKNRQTV